MANGKSNGNQTSELKLMTPAEAVAMLSAIFGTPEKEKETKKAIDEQKGTEICIETTLNGHPYIERMTVSDFAPHHLISRILTEHPAFACADRFRVVDEHDEHHYLFVKIGDGYELYEYKGTLSRAKEE